MKTVDLEDLQEDLAGYMQLASAGEEYSIRRDGVAIARLLPADATVKLETTPVPIPDFMARLKEDYPGGPVEDGPTAFILQDREKRPW